MAQATTSIITSRLKTAPRRRKGVPDALAALAAATGETKDAALYVVARLRAQAERTIERLLAFLNSTEPTRTWIRRSEPRSWSVGLLAVDDDDDDDGPRLRFR